MKFLVDVQLPPRLVRHLRRLGFDAVHVTDLVHPTTPDPDIHALAVREGRAIITKDEDFVYLARDRRSCVVVCLRCGNVDNATLMALVERNIEPILLQAKNGIRIIEVR
jgi:predicted nuclease of predicted toxin-antitoxin system